jgi:hypothetical protein
MQIPILNGVFTDSDGDFRSSYPVNMVPVPKRQGISNGYLRPAEGIDSVSTGPGTARGSINWNGLLYAVMGTKLVSVASSGSVTEIGDVGGTGDVSMTYSFDRLAVASGNKLFLYDGTTLTEVTDADLGTVLDVIWIDGYFMTTDGTSLVVTELTDPTAVDPLKYGSSEVNPDSIKGLEKLDNEVYAINRYTIEVFDNVGGTGFPFARIESAMTEAGAVGTHAFAIYGEVLAFLGGKKNEPCSIWTTLNGQLSKIATREIETLLQEYTEAQLATARLEVKHDKLNAHLQIHLPDKCLVYDAIASQAVEEPVWHVLSSGANGEGQYRGSYLRWVHDAWFVFDPQSSAFGKLTSSHAHHWGAVVGWSFGTDILYNKGNGAIFHDLELVCLTGRVANGKDPTITTQYTLDGMSWSVPRAIKVGKVGDRMKRLVWFNQGNMQHWRSQRFAGTSDAFISPTRLEATIEALAA